MESDGKTGPQKEEKSDPLRVYHSHPQMKPTKDNTDITLTTSQVPAPSPFRRYRTQMQTQTHTHTHPRVPLIHLLSAKKQSQSERDTFALLKKIFSVIMLITMFT